MSPLKEALILIKGMSYDELTNVQVFLEVLLEVAKPDADNSPLQKLGAASYEYRKAKSEYRATIAQPAAKAPLTAAQLTARKANLDKARAKRWPKTRRIKRRIKRRPYDAFHAKAENASRVWEALTQSSGWLSARDLSEYVGLEPGRVSAILCNLWAGRHKKVMARRKRVEKTEDGTGKWCWEYQYCPRTDRPRTSSDEGGKDGGQ